MLEDLRTALGAAYVLEAPSERRLHAQDVYREGPAPLAVVRPGDTAGVQAVVRIAVRNGCALFVRGGGMSYSDACIPDRTQSLVVDMRRLCAVHKVDARDLTATVGAGCTWAALDAALQPHGLRARFWGPMSGRLATIGGGMSQGAATFGSARHGTSASAALAFEVVLGDGAVLDTGSGGGSGGAFFRPYGPDLTGLFTGDAGALGIKTAVTLQLEPRPATHGAVAFGFDAFGPLAQAVSAVAREGLATEIFGLESSLATLAAADTGREPAWRTALAVARAQNGPWRALMQLARIAAAGRSFARGTAFTANFIAEARDGAALGRALDAIRDIAARSGREIPNTLAAVVRATPFPEPPVVGPGGRRLLALHAILPHSRVDAFHDAVLRLRAAESAALQAHRAALFVVFAVVGPSAVLHEPVIYWEDEWNDLHHAMLPAALRGTVRPGPANPAGRAYVEQLRQRLVALMTEHGAAHLQIGRAYPYLQGRSPVFLATVGALKRLTDPHNLINPGALGLPP